jgi:hypothetical protein
MAGPPGSAQARVQGCGKSAPAPGATSAARQPPPGARSNRGPLARRRPARAGSQPPGGPHRWMAVHAESRKGPPDRIPPTGPLTAWGSRGPGDLEADSVAGATGSAARRRRRRHHWFARGDGSPSEVTMASPAPMGFHRPRSRRRADGGRCWRGTSLLRMGRRLLRGGAVQRFGRTPRGQPSPLGGR